MVSDGYLLALGVVEAQQLQSTVALQRAGHVPGVAVNLRYRALQSSQSGTVTCATRGAGDRATEHQAVALPKNGREMGHAAASRAWVAVKSCGGTESKLNKR